MSEQANLFAEKSHALLRVEYAIMAARSRGQVVTEWHIAVMLEWARRFPQGGAGGTGPTVCRCLRCESVNALIVPGDPNTNTAKSNQGYCICRECSAPKNQTVGAWS